MIGENIRECRKQAGMTQGALASKVGLTTAAVSNYENEISSPSIEMLSKLADALGTTTDRLLSGNRTNRETGNTQDEGKEAKLISMLETVIETNSSQQTTIGKLVDLIGTQRAK